MICENSMQASFASLPILLDMRRLLCDDEWPFCRISIVAGVESADYHCSTFSLNFYEKNLLFGNPTFKVTEALYFFLVDHWVIGDSILTGLNIKWSIHPLFPSFDFILPGCIYQFSKLSLDFLPVFRRQAFFHTAIRSLTRLFFTSHLQIRSSFS